MLDLKSSGTTAAELPRTTAFTNLSMLFADASSSYKGGWSHATSPAPGQGESHLSLFTKRWDLDRGIEVCVRETSATARSPAATLIAADPTTRTDPGTPSPADRDPHPRTYPLPNQRRNQIV
ncbi:hypothetical protein ALC57_14436 [Trachymyrmex cornetzi]|uniref:Uncharacterized protein n=1 Tax=Trachymyrmex cornetzi TaxID=471704 RepID=A0A195DKL7_9HYME|nr:hypothetical protein ALC57_14436 [Trachymyrmex cornetzi]